MPVRYRLYSNIYCTYKSSTQFSLSAVICVQMKQHVWFWFLCERFYVEQNKLIELLNASGKCGQWRGAGTAAAAAAVVVEQSRGPGEPLVWVELTCNITWSATDLDSFLFQFLFRILTACCIQKVQTMRLVVVAAVAEVIGSSSSSSNRREERERDGRCCWLPEGGCVWVCVHRLVLRRATHTQKPNDEWHFITAPKG